MHIHNKVISAVYKLLLIALVVLGIIESFRESASVSPLRYFTMQCNILVGLVTLYLLLELRRRGEAYPRVRTYFRGLTMLAISIAGIVFRILLAPDYDHIGFANLVADQIVPIAFVLDWLLFDRKGALRFRDIPVWMIFPLAYVVINLITALHDGFYPYPFMDVSLHGYGGVAVTVVLMVIAFSALGALYVGIDRLLSRRARGAPAFRSG